MFPRLHPDSILNSINIEDPVNHYYLVYLVFCLSVFSFQPSHAHTSNLIQRLAYHLNRHRKLKGILKLEVVTRNLVSLKLGYSSIGLADAEVMLGRHKRMSVSRVLVYQFGLCWPDRKSVV